MAQQSDRDDLKRLRLRDLPREFWLSYTSYSTRLDRHRLKCTLAGASSVIGPGEEAHKHLEAAERHYAANEIGSAWTAVKAAIREHNRHERPETAPDLVKEILTEAPQKLSGWRLDAVYALLGNEPSSGSVAGRIRRLEKMLEVKPQPDATITQRLERLGGPLGIDGPRGNVAEYVEAIEGNVETTLVDRVAEARQIIDEHFDNVYMKSGILGVTIRRAAWLAVFILGALCAAVAAGWVPEQTDVSHFVLGEWGLYISVGLLGALGATVSGATSIVSASQTMRIPDLKLRRMLMITRPLFGAASALLVVIILQSGLTAIELSEVGIFASAVVAGFSERLLTRAVAAASSALVGDSPPAS